MAIYILTGIIGIAAVIGAELFIKWCKANGHENWIPPEDIEE